jgi:hypothetical protein
MGWSDIFKKEPALHVFEQLREIFDVKKNEIGRQL